MIVHPDHRINKEEYAVELIAHFSDGTTSSEVFGPHGAFSSGKSQATKEEKYYPVGTSRRVWGDNGNSREVTIVNYERKYYVNTPDWQEVQI